MHEIKTNPADEAVDEQRISISVQCVQSVSTECQRISIVFPSLSCRQFQPHRTMIVWVREKATSCSRSDTSMRTRERSG